MKKTTMVCLLIFGLIMMSRNMVYAGDSFYVIPVKKCCTCEGTLNGTRWCNNGDGTVTDMTTCLVWLRYASWGMVWPWTADPPFDYDDAHTRAGLLADGTVLINSPPFVVVLNDGSVLGEWRLPTKTELEGITTGEEAVSSGEPRVFINVLSKAYWTSTTFAGNHGRAYVVSLTNGLVFDTNKVLSYDVWPVRDAK